MPPGVPVAATISVRETLEALDGPYAALAAGVAEDRYALWLGSGISLGRVDGLSKLIPRVLEFLRQRVEPGSPTCRFRKALNTALSLAPLTPEELAHVELGQPFSTWAIGPSIVARLTTNYARLLDIVVDGEPDDFLLWSGIDVDATFADPAIEPDVEHLCIAILALEGVASDIATANWDGLVERAADRLNSGLPALAVCVRPEELREPRLRAWLYKFHGCGVRAVADEANYRSCLVGRQSQINGWAARPGNAPIVNRLVAILVSKPTLMLGLSAQDANVQALFSQAEAQMPWPWPDVRPAIVFSEDGLGVDQQGLLKNVYRAACTPATRQQILQGALVRAFAKPLLIALVLHVICTKIGRLVDHSPGTLGSADRDTLRAGLVALRNKLAEAVGADSLGFVTHFIECGGRIISMFREGRASGSPGSYQPLSPNPMQQIPGDQTLLASGLPEVAAALGILGTGERSGFWKVESSGSADPKAGALRVHSASGLVKVFFAAHSHAALVLRHNGYVADDDDAVVIHGLSISPTMARSPIGAPGRIGRVGPREVSFAELLNEVSNGKDLMQRFREELAI